MFVVFSNSYSDNQDVFSALEWGKQVAGKNKAYQNLSAVGKSKCGD
jgi:hypothetical protein